MYQHVDRIAHCFAGVAVVTHEVDADGPIARRVIAHAPERVIWGSNWPHVGVVRKDYPDDAMLLDILLDWASPNDVEKILVDNPAELYCF
jgi:D-galactarolactone isomerase